MTKLGANQIPTSTGLGSASIRLGAKGKGVLLPSQPRNCCSRPLSLAFPGRSPFWHTSHCTKACQMVWHLDFQFRFRQFWALQGLEASLKVPNDRGSLGGRIVWKDDSLVVFAAVSRARVPRFPSFVPHLQMAS